MVFVEKDAEVGYGEGAEKLECFQITSTIYRNLAIITTAQHDLLTTWKEVMR